MEILSKLFGSSAKVKIMKLFLSNPDRIFDNNEVSKRAKVILTTLRKELNTLEKIQFIKRKTKNKKFISSTTRQKGGKKIAGWLLNPDFSLSVPLKNLLIKDSSLEPKEITGRLKGAGTLKLVIISGVLIQNEDSRVDILIVGDNLNNSYLERAIRVLESEIGRELKYVVLDTNDFKYRLGVYDKLLRDILDYSHKKLINRLGI